MRIRAIGCFVMIGWSSPFASACSQTTSTAVPPITTVTLDGGSDAAGPVAAAVDLPDAGDETTGDAAATGDFFACAADSDCTAVPKNSCCNNGFREAVNKQQAGAYKASFSCQPRKRICPMFRIRDTRTPHCNADSHKCELVKTDSAPIAP